MSETDNGRARVIDECIAAVEEYDSGGYGSHKNMVIAQRTSIEIAAVLRALRERPVTEAELHKIINNIQHPPPDLDGGQ
jgi:hypothetical protein